MSKTRGQPAHIQCLEGNDQGGKDRVIGDLHGNLTTLLSVLTMLKHPHDRLFIAGDLTDRGEQNFEIIETILRYNANPHQPGKIYCIRGNHEDMCLDTIAALERLNLHFDMRITDTELEKFRAQQNSRDVNKGTLAYLSLLETVDYVRYPEHLNDIDSLMLHVDPRNGGEWLLALYFHEVQSGYIATNDEEVIYHPNSCIRKIKKYLSDLPYVIHVKGNEKQFPFNVVHADMPINDKRLLRLIRKKWGLKSNEIKHACWARMGGDKVMRRVEKVGREQDSIVAYVGHTIISHENIADCVRVGTNTFDLDVGSYFTGCAIVVNHTDLICESSEVVTNDHFIFDVMMRINENLSKLPQKEKSRQFKLKSDEKPGMHKKRKQRSTERSSETDDTEAMELDQEQVGKKKT